MKKLLTILLAFIMIFSFAACGGSDAQEPADASGVQEYVVDENAETLTVAGAGHEAVVFAAEDLEKLGTVTLDYSGRNKEVQNARQFFTYTGVELNKVLEAAGFETDDAIIKVTCSDGYTREYEVEDLYGLYTFESNENDNKTEVVPIIAIQENMTEKGMEYPSPFKLVYGQADYDTQDAQDFNMQGWMTFIQYIEVSYEE